MYVRWPEEGYQFLREEEKILEVLEAVGVRPKGIYSMFLKDRKRKGSKRIPGKIKRGERKK
jgi:hypothetical protein